MVISLERVQNYAKEYLVDVGNSKQLKGFAGPSPVTYNTPKQHHKSKQDNLIGRLDLDPIDNFESKITGKHVYRYKLVYKATQEESDIVGEKEIPEKEIPIYGSSVVAEAKGNKLKFTSSKVDKITYTGKEATEIRFSKLIYYSNFKNELDLISCLSGNPNNLGYWIKDIKLKPTLYYYYEHFGHPNSDDGRWRLVWVTNIPTEEFDNVKGKDFPDMLSKLADYIVDTETGEIIATLPRYRSFR